MAAINLLTARAATGPSPSFQTNGDYVAVVVSGTFTATVVLEMSADNVTFTPVTNNTTFVTSLTAAGVMRAPSMDGYFARVNVTAYTSGSLTAQVPGSAS